MTSSSSPKRRILIINADDLGYSQARDMGIFLAFQNGCVTSASLIVNGFTSNTAAKEAIRLGLPLGLHLNLTEGEPIAKSVHSIVVRNGDVSVFRGKLGFRIACEKGQVEENEVEAEILAQIHEFKRLTSGKTPTHVDGHQHCHLLSFTREIFAKTLKTAGIFRTRLPIEAPLFL